MKTEDLETAINDMQATAKKLGIPVETIVNLRLALAIESSQTRLIEGGVLFGLSR